MSPSISTLFLDGRVPPFLYGTFDWNSNGYFLAYRPPEDLVTAKALNHANPLVQIAAITEFAKSGDFRHVQRLERFIRDGDPLDLAQLALWLVGDMGQGAELDLIGRALAGKDPHLRWWAAEAACLSGVVAFVAPMVEAWEHAETREQREGIGYLLSNLLEPAAGEIAASSGIYIHPRMAVLERRPELIEIWKGLNERRSKEVLLPERVAVKLAALQEEHPGVTVLWRGAAWDVGGAAQSLLAIARDGRADDIRLWRHKLEAATGWDCRAFFRGGQANPLGIAAVIEDFLDSGQTEKYEPSVRYFFGHRIPEA